MLWNLKKFKCMRESLRDPLRLEHILDAIDRLLAGDKNNHFDKVSERDIEYFGVVKLLEIIGEAAYKLTDEFKIAHTQTPWRYIIAMRHILVHGYYQINRNDVLKTIREDLPVLREQVVKYLYDIDS